MTARLRFVKLYPADTGQPLKTMCSYKKEEQEQLFIL